MASTFVPDQRVQSTAARYLFRALLALGVTAASIALNLLVPQLATTEQSLVFVGVVAVVLVGLWRGLARAEPSGSARFTVWFAVAMPFVAWLVLVWWLALLGAFRTGIPVLPLAIVLPLLIGLPVLLRSRRIGAVLDATPASWLIGLQVYRIFGSIFLVSWLLGALSGIFAVPAGVVILGFLSTPGPLQLFATTAVGPIPIIVYPLVMIPAFAVPSSILLHALSLRQLRRLDPLAAS